MEFAILGPLEVRAGTVPVEIRRGLPRALLLNLVLRAGEVVSFESLIDNLWGEDLPANPPNALQTQVSYLRRVLGAADASGRELIETRAVGYVLSASADEIDARRFERIVAEARRFADSGTAPALEAALERFGDGLALWRGDPLADAASLPFAVGEATRLCELRLSTIEHRVDVLLRLGRHQEAAEELALLGRDHPLREAFHEQLMLALYRSGRQAEALRAFESARTQLAEELGLDPGPSLRALEVQVLSQAPALDWIPPPGFDGGPSYATFDTAFARPAPAALPAWLTPLIGRDVELHRLTEVLQRTRLLTITGPGGAGKSRVAVELARRDAREIWFVDLSPVQPDEVAVGVAATLGIPTPPDQDPVDPIADALVDREGLLVLDTCEHVVDGVASLAGLLLRRCPRLTIVATSRRAVGVAGEIAWPLPPLSVPAAGVDDPAVAADHAAVALFCARAAAVRPAFELDASNLADVIAICGALDGLPLGIELAAAHVDVLTPRSILARLASRFELLVGGGRDASERQQTLQATFDWSLALLDAPEQELFVRLSVFSGSFDLDAVAAVVGECSDPLPLVANLVRQSMVVATGDDRFRLLDSLRDYGRDVLAATDDTDELRCRHATWFTTLAEAADVKVRSDEQDLWLRRLHGELPNLRAALEWSFEHEPALGARLAIGLGWFFTLEGMLIEAERWLQRALEVPDLPPELRTGALIASAHLAAPLGRLVWARDACDEAAALAREAGDGWQLGSALITAGVARWGLDDFDGAVRDHEEAIACFDLVGNRWGRAVVSALLARTAVDRGDSNAEALLEQAEPEARRTGDRHILALIAEQRARLATARGDPQRALETASECLALHESVGSPEGTAAALHVLGQARRATGDLNGAKSVHLRALETATSIGHAAATAEALEDLAILAADTGDLDRALFLACIARRERQETGLLVRRPDRPRIQQLTELLAAAFGHEPQPGPRLSDVLDQVLELEGRTALAPPQISARATS